MSHSPPPPPRVRVTKPRALASSHTGRRGQGGAPGVHDFEIRPFLARDELDEIGQQRFDGVVHGSGFSIKTAPATGVS